MPYRQSDISNIKVQDLYKIHNSEAFYDTYLITVSLKKGKIIDVQKMLLNTKELNILYQKLKEVLE